MAQGIEGRVALVLGGSSGIGRAVALRLASLGAHVAVGASRDVTRARAVVQALPAGSPAALELAADVNDFDALRRAVAEVEAHLGAIDLLVNSAGIYLETPILAFDPLNARRVLDTNMTGTLYAIAAVAPSMVARKFGRIVNIASVAGLTGIRGFSAYCASKAAIAMCTRALALELAPHDVRVNAVAPGNTATPMNERFRLDAAHATYLEGMKRATPSGAVFSSAEDIASAAVWLLSDEARPFHGATLLADEGLSAGLSL